MFSSCFAKPRTIAGKRASPVRGITIFPTLDRRSAGQLACESPPERHPEVENHSRSCSRPLTDAERPPMIVSLGRTPPENVPNRRPENPASETLDTWERSPDASPWRHSFKMPITTTVLSRNNASRQCLEAPSARDPVHQKAARRRDAFFGEAMDRGSSRKTGAGLNPRHGSRDRLPSPNHSSRRVRGASGIGRSAVCPREN
jgi:hypothetical protein